MWFALAHVVVLFPQGKCVFIVHFGGMQSKRAITLEPVETETCCI